MDENLQFVLASAALHDTIARVITAAADGSALNNPGPAGWAWFIDDTCWAAGGWPSSTNNRGELQAVLDLLHQTAHVDDELTVLCDSQYVINVITKWMSGWKRKGWKKADGRPVLNVDLVQALDEAMLGRNVTFEWVRGHSGHELNEAADKLARAAAEAFRDGTKVKSGPGFPALEPLHSPQIRSCSPNPTTSPSSVSPAMVSMGICSARSMMQTFPSPRTRTSSQPLSARC